MAIFAIRRFFTAFPVLLLLSIHAYGDALDFWTYADSRGTANYLLSAAQGNGLRVVVGEWGTVLTSRDGRSWKNRSLQTDTQFRAIGFGDGQFIAALTEGFNAFSGTAHTYLLASSDAENWRTVHTHSAPVLYGRTETIRKIIHANGLWVAIGGCADRHGGPTEVTSLILISTDGEQWEKVHNVQGPSLYDVEFIRGNFYAVGQEKLFMTSPDARNWISTRINEFGDLRDLRETDEGFIVLATSGVYNGSSWIYSSTNGQDWVKVSTITEWGLHKKLVRSGSEWLALGEAGKQFASTNLIEWRPMDFPATSEVYDAMEFSDGPFIVGSQGLIASGPSDGGIQIEAHRPPTFIPWSIAFGKGKYVAVGNRLNQIATSTDAISWKFHSITPPMTIPFVGGVVYGNGVFLASGQNERVYRSEDGETWEKVHEVGPYRVWNILWHEDMFVAANEAGIQTSPDGRIWTHVSSNVFNRFTQGGGKLLAHGYESDPFNPGLYLSTNAVDWQRIDIPWPSSGPVAYGNGRFVIRTDNLPVEDQMILISTNGSDWEMSRQSLPGHIMQFAGGRFINSGAHPGLITSSRDGLNWTPHFIPSPVAIGVVVAHGDCLILVDEVGTTLRSAPLWQDESILEEVEVDGAGFAKLHLRTPFAGAYRLEKSTDLNNWEQTDLLRPHIGRASVRVATPGKAFFRVTRF